MSHMSNIFSQYLQTKNAVKLHNTDYYVKHDAGVYFNDRLLPVEVIDGVPNVKLTWLGQTKLYPFPFIIAAAYKCLHLPLKFYHKLSVETIAASDNYHPANLMWRFPERGIEVPGKPGFYYIPMFTRYAINREGEVWSTFQNKLLSLEINRDGYKSVNLKHDLEKRRGCRIHRLILLTFSKYPVDVETLAVNHKDGNKLNNKLENLEWCTIQENNTHAVKTGLTVRSVPVRVTNLTTNEVMLFTNKTELMKSGFKALPQTDYILKYCGGVIEKNGFRIEFLPTEINKHVPSKLTTQRAVLIRDARLDKILRYETLGEAAVAIGMEKHSLGYRLSKSSPDAINGFQFKYADDIRPWPVVLYSDDTTVNSKTTDEMFIGLRQTVQVYDEKTGVETTFDKAKDAAELVGLTAPDMSRLLTANDQSLITDRYRVKRERFQWGDEKILKATALRKRNTIVLLDTLTDEETHYDRGRDICALLGIADSTLSTCLANDKQTLYNDRYRFKRIDVPWKPKAVGKLKNEGYVPVEVTDKQLNTVTVYNTAVSAAKALDMKVTLFHYHLEKNPMKLIKGRYILKRLDK